MWIAVVEQNLFLTICYAIFWKSWQIHQHLQLIPNYSNIKYWNDVVGLVLLKLTNNATHSARTQKKQQHKVQNRLLKLLSFILFLAQQEFPLVFCISTPVKQPKEWRHCSTFTQDKRRLVCCFICECCVLFFTLLHSVFSTIFTLFPIIYC